jgi:hypothetical protein
VAQCEIKEAQNKTLQQTSGPKHSAGSGQEKSAGYATAPIHLKGVI